MRIKIYRDAIDPDDLDELIRLVEEAGHEPVVVDGLPAEDCDPDETSVVILYPDGSPLFDAVAIVARTGATGCTVFGVWPGGAVDQPTPAPFAHHGRGAAIWNSGSLNRVLTSPTPCWLRPNGESRPVPERKHWKCGQ